MAAFFHCFLLFMTLLPLCHCATVSPQIGNFCGESINDGGATASNIRKVIADLAARTPLDGFAVSSAGKGNNTIYGLAQCRGDVSMDDCGACIADAAKQLPKLCPNQVDGRVWYDYCLMRFDNTNFVGRADTGYAVILVNTETADNPKAFDKDTGKLLTKVRADAVIPGNHNLGRGKKQFSPFTTIYALADCTRDLSPLSCSQCLAATVDSFPTYCQYRKGCQIHYSSCSARYEIYPFFFPLDTSVKASPASTAAKGSTFKVMLHP